MKYKLLLFIKINGEQGATCFGLWQPSSGLQIRYKEDEECTTVSWTIPRDLLYEPKL